ncbi:MAG: T9SS type A sorting domain-containing protein [Bacteroidales bacterium]
MKTLSKTLLTIIFFCWSGLVFSYTNPVNTVVCAGGTATFTIGTPPTGYSCRWQMAADGNKYADLKDATIISGAGTPTLTIIKCPTNLNGFYFRCMFYRTGYASTFTSGAILAVTGVLTDPTDASACAGGTAVFSISATNTVKSYSWEVCTSGTTYTAISAAGSNPTYSNWTTNTLTLTNPSANGWKYRCKVTYTTPTGCTDYSNAAILYLITAKPTINTQPASKQVCPNITFTVPVIVNEPGVTYQWQANIWRDPVGGIPGSWSGYFNITASNTYGFTGFNSSVLSVAGWTTSEVKFKCIVTNCIGSTTSGEADITFLQTVTVGSVSPANNIVCNGSNTAFNVYATGDGLTYQWQLSTNSGTSWSTISSGGSGPAYTVNASNLSLTGVVTGNSGYQYRCNVGGTCNAAVPSSAATLSVVPSAPTISVNPISTSACSGNSTTFTLTPGNSVSQTYQWKVSVNGGAYSPVSNGGTGPAYSGATTASLSLSGIISANNNNMYQCIQTNVCNAVPSNSAKLTVYDPLIQSLAPVDRLICEGNQTSFTHTATGSIVSRQWYYLPTGSQSWLPVTASSPVTPNHNGFTDATLTITAPNFTNNGMKYKSVITGQSVCSPLSLESPVVTLGVNRRIVIAAPKNDTTQTTCTGNGTILAVAAGGTSILFQWYVNVANQGWTPISEAGTQPSYAGWNSAALNISQTTLSNHGYKYRCIITSPTPCNEKDTSKIFILNVNGPPGTLNPISGPSEICSGSTGAIFTVDNLPAASTYVWTVPSGVTGASSTNISTLVFPEGSSGTIKVKAVNACGESNEVSKTITVKTPSVQAEKIVPVSGIVCPGTSTKLQVQGGSLGTGASWKWYAGSCSGTPLGTGVGITLTNLQTTQVYYVKAEGDCNVTDCVDTTIAVLTSSVIRENPVNTSACYADSATFSVLADGPEPLAYKWFKGTSPITGFQETNKLTLRDLTFSDQGQYRCTVTSACDATGIQSQSATLTILAQPSLNLGADKHLCPGGKVTLNAGTGYASYLWNTGETTKNKDVLEQGMYTVTVTDGNGCWNTDDIYVIEDALLPPVSLGPDISVCMNTPVLLDASDQYDSYSWNNGSQTQQLNVTNSGTYWVLVGRNSTVCTGIDSVQVHIAKPFDQEKLCIVTVSRTGKNMLVWEKTPDAGIVSYNIWKASSVAGEYNQIANVPADNLSIFVDQNSMPEVRSDRYKISAVDTCKNESPRSPFHKTMHLVVTQALPKGYALSWDEIAIENINFKAVFPTFYVYRGPSYANLALIDSFSSENENYTDPNPPPGKVFYQISAKKLSSCHPAGSLKSDEDYSSSFSNVDDIVGTGIEILAQDGKLLVYPNPFSETTQIEFSNPEARPHYLMIYDLTGKLVRTEGPVNSSSFTFERKNLDKGCYLLEIWGKQILRGRMVIE